MDRGPARASDHRQPFAPAAPQGPGRGRSRRARCSRSTTSSATTRAPICAPMPCASREMTCGILPGPYRVAGLSRRRPLPPHQQDAGRHLSRARAATRRTFVRERLIDAIAAQARDRSDRRAPRATSSRRTRCPTRGRSSVLRGDESYDSGDYTGLLDKVARRRSAGTSCRPNWRAPARARRTRRRRACDVRREERAWPDRRRACERRHQRHGRSHHRRRVGRAGLRDRDGAGLRRRRSASTTASVRVVHGRTDRIEFGIGAHASRATVMTANAVACGCAQGARQRRSTCAAELMQSAGRRSTSSTAASCARTSRRGLR